MPTFSKAQKRRILDRDGVCVPCTYLHKAGCAHSDASLLWAVGDPSEARKLGFDFHHRAGRGLGSAKSLNTVSNGLLVCSWSNSRVEDDDELAGIWRAHGWLLNRNAWAPPGNVPIDVYTYSGHRRLLLTDDGHYKPTGPAPAGPSSWKEQ